MKSDRVPDPGGTKKRRGRKKSRSYPLPAAGRWLVACCVVLALAACSGGAGVEPAAEAAPATAVATAAQVIPTIAVAVGDPALGEALFNDRNRTRCSGCHTLDGGTQRPGPTLLGISEAAGERVAGLTAAEYVRQSLLDPEAYLVEGFEETEKPMPVYTVVEPNADGPMKLATITEEELDNLIAFVLTH